MKVEGPFVDMFFLNWKVKYYVFQVLENTLVLLYTSSLVIQNTALIAAEIKSKSMTAES